jgi:esterase/lipase superfamily enzyme
MRRFICLFLLFGLASCANRPLVVPPPLPPPPPAPPPAPATAATKQVELIFATDRVVNPSGNSFDEKFTNEFGPIVYGTATVSIPPSHQVGMVERPLWYRLEFRENPDKHVVLVSAKVDDSKAVFARAKQLIKADRQKSALVFVHGFNVPFQDAALRAGQLAVDLDLNALPTFFSWPSQGQVTKYTVDETLSERARPHLEAYFEHLVDDTKVDRVFVIAHSMGSRIATASLANLLQRRRDLRPKFVTLVLAAPDIDGVVFKDQLLPQFARMHVPVTLYASSKDKALVASRKIHSCCRAGEAGDNLILGNGLETIDASSVDTDFLSHSYFAEDRGLLTDLSLLLKDKRPAKLRPMLEGRPIASQKPQYWVIKP